MRANVRSLALVALPLLAVGCMRQTSRVEVEPPLTPVAVRFTLPDESERFTETDTSFESHLVADETYEGFAEGEWTEAATTTTPRMKHVALWGGPFEAADVTDSVATLTPGTYMFAVVEPSETKIVEGWLEVNFQGDDILDVLHAWKNAVPEQKQRLIYAFDIAGRLPGDEVEFASFNQQLRALTRLENRIDATIAAEVKARSHRGRELNDFLSAAEVLLLPGEQQLFHPTTKPVFAEDELENVREGEIVTKIVLVADYDQAQWKMHRVNALYNDLERLRTVLRETSDRLERRKGLMLLTDHLHRHDTRFIKNEQGLQYVLAELERVEQHMDDLRSRRIGLAFVSELVAGDGGFAALKREQDELLRERAVLQADKRRLDIMFTESAPESVKRVAFERSRQRVASAIDRLDRQLAGLNDARHALATMSESTNVIHRQGGKRLLTTTFVGEQLPFPVRDAVEREALLTARLEGTDRVFVPEPTTFTQTVGQQDNLRPAYGNVFTSHVRGTSGPVTRPASDFRPSTISRTTTPSSFDGVSATGSSPSQRASTTTSPVRKTADTPPTEVPTSPGSTTPAGSPVQPGARPVNKESSRDPQTGDNEKPVVRPGEKINDPKSGGAAVTAPKQGRLASGQPGQDATGSKTSGAGCDCPFILKLLVPPCWFLEK